MVRALLVFVGFGCGAHATGPLFPVRPRTQVPSPAGCSASPAEAELFAATNRSRSRVGQAPLSWSFELCAVAQQHARDMASREAIGHESATTGKAPDRLARAGIPFLLVQENVGRGGSAARLHDDFMASERHRDAILNPDMTVAAIGAVEQAGVLYVNELFTKPPRLTTVAAIRTAVAARLAHLRVDADLNRVARRLAQRGAGGDPVADWGQSMGGCKSPLVFPSVGPFADRLIGSLEPGPKHLRYGIGTVPAGPDIYIVVVLCGSKL